MTRWSRRAATAAATVAVAWIAIGGATGVASAHAEFQESTVIAGSTTTLTLDVPNERPAPRYTTTVRIQIAEGWTAVGCTQPAGWTCTTGGGEIAFQFAGGSQQEAFSFTLRAPDTARTSTFPVVQIYDNAENVLWSDTAVLRVGVDPSPSPPTSAPAPSPPTSVAPGPTRPADAATAGASQTGESPTTSSATATPDGSVTSDGGGEVTSSRAADSNGGSPIVPVILGVLAVLVIGGVIVIVRRRT